MSKEEEVDYNINRVTEAIELAKNNSMITKNLIDGLATRGSFKGEEFLVVGQLREACMKFLELSENLKN